MNLKIATGVCVTAAALMLIAAFASAFIACWSDAEGWAAQACVAAVGAVLFGCGAGMCSELDKLSR